jgi:hypothetical protein
MKTTEKLTIKAVAERLNGREYMHEVTKDERNEFSFDGITVVVGASDDNVEFYGYIDDEIGCWEEIIIPVLDDEILKKCSDDCEDYDCPLWRNALSKAKNIRARFTNEGWKFDADFPHEKFVIMEDGEVFGEGIVFSKEDLSHENT